MLAALCASLTGEAGALSRSGAFLRRSLSRVNRLSQGLRGAESPGSRSSCRAKVERNESCISAIRCAAGNNARSFGSSSGTRSANTRGPPSWCKICSRAAISPLAAEPRAGSLISSVLPLALSVPIRLNGRSETEVPGLHGAFHVLQTSFRGFLASVRRDSEAPRRVLPPDVSLLFLRETGVLSSTVRMQPPEEHNLRRITLWAKISWLIRRLLRFGEVGGSGGAF